MRTKTHLFYLDDQLAEQTDLRAGDRLIYAGGAYSAFRGEIRLYCRIGESSDTEFAIVGQSHPVHGALDLAEEYGLSPRIMKEKIFGGEHEWELAAAAKRS